jgi:hypothetical protein
MHLMHTAGEPIPMRRPRLRDAGQSGGMKNHPALDATTIGSPPNKDLEKAFFG